MDRPYSYDPSSHGQDSYKGISMKLPTAKPSLLHSWGSATALTLPHMYLNYNETKLIQICLRVSLIILHPLYQ